MPAAEIKGPANQAGRRRRQPPGGTRLRLRPRARTVLLFRGVMMSGAACFAAVPIVEGAAAASRITGPCLSEPASGRGRPLSRQDGEAAPGNSAACRRAFEPHCATGFRPTIRPGRRCRADSPGPSRIVRRSGETLVNWGRVDAGLGSQISEARSRRIEMRSAPCRFIRASRARSVLRPRRGRSTEHRRR